MFDSTIVIDHLNGVPEATALFEAEAAGAISVITWIEAAVGLRPGTDEAAGRAFFSTLEVIPLSQSVADEAVRIRRTSRLKLPDAVILASARVAGLVLVTRNTKDFHEADAGVQIPYRL